MLEKTNRINLLYDFYQSLLTTKQRTILEYYFHDDFSLGEIAEELQVSRQAVFEHLRRAEASLNELETNLQLLEKHEKRLQVIQRLTDELKQVSDASVRNRLVEQVQAIIDLE